MNERNYDRAVKHPRSRRSRPRASRRPLLAALTAATALFIGCSEASDPEVALAGEEELAPQSGDHWDHRAASYACTRQNVTVRVRARGLQRIVASGGYAGRCRIYGDRRSLGDGALQSYFVSSGQPDGKPEVIGLEFSRATLDNLPDYQNDGASCFDVNGDGELDDHHECAGGTSRELDLPREAMKATALKWILVNWNLHGHPPVGVYNVPHFDIHFYIQTERERNFIRPGPCSLLVDCADNDRANKPLPARYLPAGYENTFLVESRMGGHLINFARAPEFDPDNGGSDRFGATMIFGQYDGHLTFIEPMVSLAYFMTKPNQCYEIDQPQSYEIKGYYPTRYCVNYNGVRQEYTVSLESFVYFGEG